MFTRRNFLKISSLLTWSPVVPSFLLQTARATTPQTDGRILVVLQLDGGNDGINTVVPFRDDGYARHRRQLRLSTDRLVRINDQLGLHPSWRDFGNLFESRRLAIVQGVGYPNPNRSHFRSMAVWHSARLDPEEHTGIGWLGRALDERPPRQQGPAALLVGESQPPVAIRGRRAAAAAIESAEDFALVNRADMRSAIGPDTSRDDLTAFVRRGMIEACTAADRLSAAARGDASAPYPGTGLGKRLELVARLIKAGFGTRIYYTVQSGYDTHASQLPAHANLLFELSTALKAFLDDLSAARLDERVLVLCFSEFGRTVRENGSAGTDHGTAAPVFLAGTPVRGGVIGTAPSLTDLDPTHGDLRVSIDFRRVYATILHDWMGLSDREALGGSFERLALVRT